MRRRNPKPKTKITAPVPAAPIPLAPLDHKPPRLPKIMPWVRMQKKPAWQPSKEELREMLREACANTAMMSVPSN